MSDTPTETPPPEGGNEAIGPVEYKEPDVVVNVFVNEDGTLTEAGVQQAQLGTPGHPGTGVDTGDRYDLSNPGGDVKPETPDVSPSATPAAEVTAAPTPPATPPPASEPSS